MRQRKLPTVVELSPTLKQLVSVSKNGSSEARIVAAYVAAEPPAIWIVSVVVPFAVKSPSTRRLPFIVDVAVVEVEGVH